MAFIKQKLANNLAPGDGDVIIAAFHAMAGEAPTFALPGRGAFVSTDIASSRWCASSGYSGYQEGRLIWR
jgi:hypothetical protein